MQFTVSRNDFARLLSDVSRVVERRTTIPILANIMLTAADGALSVKGTDLDIEITRSVSATVAVPGSTTVNAARIAAVVGKLGTAEVHVTLDDGQLTLKAGRSRLTLPTLPVEDYPSLGVGTFAHTFDIDINALLAPVKYSVSNEETRYYLNGIFVHQSGATLRAVSTEGHKLARNSTGLPEGASDIPGVIIPNKAIDVFAILKGTVRVSLSSNKIRVEQDGAVITSKMIDGTFPAYERVIPRGNDKRVLVDRATLSSAVARAATIAAETGRGVKLSIVPGGVTISMRTSDGSSTEDIEAEYSNEPVDVVFNARYLLDTLANCGGDTVAIDLADAGSPALFSNPANDNWQAILMPVRV
jgi:DNA polymerase III subunit beta